MNPIAVAYAQSAGASAPTSLTQNLVSFLPLILIFGVFWFLIIRPQMTKQKQQRAMVAALKRGDRVSANGILGTITRVREDANEAEIEIAPQLRITVLRDTLVPVTVKPANDK